MVISIEGSGSLVNDVKFGLTLLHNYAPFFKDVTPPTMRHLVCDHDPILKTMFYRRLSGRFPLFHAMDTESVHI